MIEARTVPGVYIKELDAFPNSVVQVPTAIPVFIGYTETVTYQGKSLQNKAVQISSLADYTAFFGGAPTTQYTLTEWTKPTPANQNYDIPLNGKFYTIAPVAGTLFYMYNSIQLFFQNGGGTCYVLPIGTYSKEGANGPQSTDFANAFSILKGQQDPTMIVIPDSLLFAASDYYTLMNTALLHCSEVQSRITLIDAYAGDTITNALDFNAAKATTDKNGNAMDPISQLRAGITSDFLNYGVAYYPWLNTNVVSSNLITYAMLKEGFTPYIDSDSSINAIITKINSGIATATTPAQATAIHNALLTNSPNYQMLMSLVSSKINCLPAASAIAGIISVVDGSQGVWKAPANVGLTSVQSGVIMIDDDLQSNMNVDAVSGKSVNAIRSFTGQGVLVWGARTLDGNSQDWRYVNVRRTLIMIEQSVKLAARAYVFEANDANTWLNLKSTIENFLNDLWKQGALAGSKPEEAFSVSVGLGETMTPQDILNGYLDIAVLVAVTHPAEFIEITFKQQLQKS